MFRNALILSSLFIGSTALMGCNLYFEDGAGRRDQSDWCRGEGCDSPNGGGPVLGCETNEECGDGCYCTADGTCEESSFCEDSSECVEGFECDYRDSCVPAPTPEPEPEPEPVVTCQSEVTCDIAAPICPSGSTAAIVDGCYSGQCLAKADCPDGAPFECSDLNNDEAACTADASCGPVYKGVNCTSNTGADCTSASADCTCESFEYDYCE